LLLDRETGSFHADADRGWHRLLQGGDTKRDDYLRQLTATYGFEMPFEAACESTSGFSRAASRNPAGCRGGRPAEFAARAGSAAAAHVLGRKQRQ
jgi:hypothetical protein